MAHTIAEIASALRAEFAGNGDLKVSAASEPSKAAKGELALAMDPSYEAKLVEGRAKAAVLWSGADWQSLGLEAAIFVARPRFAMSQITGAFARLPEVAAGIHPSAVIDPSAQIGENAAIGPFVVIGANTVIGPNARILPHVTIGENVTIGSDALLYAGHRIGADVTIGDRFIGHQNSVVGSDGFSFVTPEAGAIEEVRRDFKVSGTAKAQDFARIHSNASVLVGDDVELGACSTIDSGTISNTVVGDGTKMDDHVLVGHNVQIGRSCLLCGQVGIAGSSVLGDQVILGGQSGVADHVNIGDNVITGAGSTVLSHVPSGRVIMGYPAVKMEQNIDSYKALRRLPRSLKRIAELEKKVSTLSGKQ